MEELTFRDNGEAHRFEVYVNGQLAGLADYRIRDGKIVFPHVEVFPRFEGRGIGTALVRCALDTVSDEGERTVVPICPFVQAFIRRYPEYESLVDGQTAAPGDE